MRKQNPEQFLVGGVTIPVTLVLGYPVDLVFHFQLISYELWKFGAQSCEVICILGNECV